jgi:sulfite exporter TauE/SafE
MLDAGIVTALLAGLTGSLHCVAMCGGYAAASQTTRAQPLVPARRLKAGRHVAQLGRLTTYLALGAAFGSAGGVALGVGWPSAQRVLYVLANLVLIATAVRIARPLAAGMALERAGLALFRHAAPLARPLVAGQDLASRYALGLLWGLTPCALIYALLPVALLSGDALRGAGVMLGLWLGTLPALLVTSRVAGHLATPGNRRAAAVAIALFGLLGLYRALFVPGALGAGPFCIAS